MVAADDEGDDVLASAVLGAGDLADDFADGVNPALGAERIDRRIPLVHHGELLEGIDHRVHLRHREGAPGAVDVAVGAQAVRSS